LNNTQRNYVSIYKAANILNISPKELLKIGANEEIEICYNWKKLDQSVKGGLGIYFVVGEGSLDETARVSSSITFSRTKEMIGHWASLPDFHKYQELASAPSDILKGLIINEAVNFIDDMGATGYGLVCCLAVDEEEKRVFLTCDDLFITSDEMERYQKLSDYKTTQDGAPTEKKLKDSLKPSGDKLQKINNFKPLTPMQEHSHLRVMGALLKTIQERSKPPFTLDALKFELEEKYGNEMDIKGFSKSSLDTLFARANKALKDK